MTRKFYDCLEILFISMPGKVYFKNKDCVYINCSDDFAKLAGISSRKEIIGKTDHNLPWKMQADVITGSDLDVFRTNKNVVIEETITLSNNKSLTFKVSKLLLADSEGEIIGILGTLIDTNKLQKNKNQYRIIESHVNTALENILNNVPAHIFWKDRNCVLLGCNDLQAKHMGFSSGKELIGKSNYDVIWTGLSEDMRKKEANAITKIDHKVMKTGMTYTVEEPLVLPDGSTAIYLSKKSPLRDEQGKIIGLLGIAFDITEKKRIDEELAGTKHKLAGMTLVSATIAHELRTPLAAIRAAVEGIKSYFPKLLDSYKLALDAKLAVPNIRTSQLKILTSVLEGVIDEINYSNIIINMSLLNTEQLNLKQGEFHICSISHCVEESLRRYPFQPGERELIHFDNKNDFNFIGEEILTVHILFNLLKNALYYIRVAHKGDIYIRLASDEKYNKLYFHDSGKGIAADILPNIFELFFSKTHHGYGVGLAFCKMIMQNYGGKVECNSVVEEFAEFILSFPK
ncbi:hypothetical protein BH10PSE19_BH10PSE19_02880 [soil metagenome]